MSHWILLAMFVLLSAGYGGGAAANIYRYVDENGVTTFTNVPTDSRYQLLQKGKLANVRGRPSMPAFNEAERNRYEAEIIAAAHASHIEPALLHAIISVESGYNRFARSNKGAVGLMQLTMDTALRYGVSNRLDPLQNVWAGATYLHDLLVMFHNDLALALAAYNAGENAVIRYGNRVPPFQETADYVPRVLAYYKKYRTLS